MKLNSLKLSRYFLKELENPPIWTEEEKKIIAWSIDWEGTISIHKSHKKSRNPKRFDLAPIITIGNTSHKLLMKFYSIIKLGTFYKRKPKFPYKQVWIWEATNFNETYYIVKNIVNYLDLKKPQAKCLIKFLESRFNRGIKTTCRLPYSKEELQCYELMHKLNRKGEHNE